MINQIKGFTVLRHEDGHHTYLHTSQPTLHRLHEAAVIIHRFQCQVFTLVFPLNDNVVLIEGITLIKRFD